MQDRNKIISQLLIFAENYDIEIIKINFSIINSSLDELEFTFKIGHGKFTIKYLYEKGNMYDINSVICYIKCKLSELLTEELFKEE